MKWINLGLGSLFIAWGFWAIADHDSAGAFIGGFCAGVNLVSALAQHMGASDPAKKAR